MNLANAAHDAPTSYRATCTHTHTHTHARARARARVLLNFPSDRNALVLCPEALLTIATPPTSYKGHPGPSGLIVPGGVPRVSPNVGVSEGVSHGVSAGPFWARPWAPSKKYPESVPGVFGTLLSSF